MRAGNWLRGRGRHAAHRQDLGLIGFGGIAAEVGAYRAAAAIKVLAWNRTAKTHSGVEFVGIEALLAQERVVSLASPADRRNPRLSLARTDCRHEARRHLVNHRARALVDEAAMIDALKSGHIRHAGLDVFNIEPLPADHALTKLPNVRCRRIPRSARRRQARISSALRGHTAAGLQERRPDRQSAISIASNCIY